MADDLESIIRHIIRANGALSVAAYWSLCMSHPQYGYYITRDPLGEGGDFTTAPEISQLFGEMVGIWIAEQWHAMGQPAAFYLVECGPGRGTLMVDILRILSIVPGMSQALQVHLVETSPALIAKQGEVLKGIQIVWHESLTTLPDNAPVIVVANEFLDALPIQQYVFQNNEWHERVIGLNDESHLQWGVASEPLDHISQVAEAGAVLELSDAREDVVHQVAQRIKAQGGAALFIDYGHDVSGFGDTLQAVKEHYYTDILKDCGEADITSHVDFGRLRHIAENDGLQVALCGQGDFLKKCGIHIRAEQLMKKSGNIEAGLKRLVDKDQMGTLFRVMEITT